MLKIRKYFPVLFALLIFSSCKKEGKIDGVLSDPPPVTSQPADVVFNFKAFVDNKVVNDSTWYTNFNSDSFTVNRLNYYISNIKLKRADGSSFLEPASYHLIKHFEAKESFTISNVPEGSYTGIEFIIGVDSAKTVSGSHAGDLDVNNVMYWDWNAGYIFFKLEGVRKTALHPEENNYGFHVGGYRVDNNCLQKCTIDLNTPLIATSGKSATVFYHAQIQEVFRNPTDLDFEALYEGGSRVLKTLSNNYRDMFKVDHITN